MLKIVKNKYTVLFPMLGLALAMAGQVYAKPGDQAAPASASKPPPVPAVTQAATVKQKPTAIPSNLKQWMDGEKAKIIVLIDADGKTKILDATGQELKPCGKVSGSTIPDGCKKPGVKNSSFVTADFAPQTTPDSATPSAAANSPQAAELGICRVIIIGNGYYFICF